MGALQDILAQLVVTQQQHLAMAQQQQLALAQQHQQLLEATQKSRETDGKNLNGNDNDTTPNEDHEGQGRRALMDAALKKLKTDVVPDSDVSKNPAASLAALQRFATRTCHRSPWSGFIGQFSNVDYLHSDEGQEQLRAWTSTNTQCAEAMGEALRTMIPIIKEDFEQGWIIFWTASSCGWQTKYASGVALEKHIFTSGTELKMRAEARETRYPREHGEHYILQAFQSSVLRNKIALTLPFDLEDKIVNKRPDATQALLRWMNKRQTFTSLTYSQQIKAHTDRTAQPTRKKQQKDEAARKKKIETAAIADYVAKTTSRKEETDFIFAYAVKNNICKEFLKHGTYSWTERGQALTNPRECHYKHPTEEEREENC
jgi:hypothetical protein